MFTQFLWCHVPSSASGAIGLNFSGLVPTWNWISLDHAAVWISTIEIKMQCENCMATYLFIIYWLTYLNVLINNGTLIPWTLLKLCCMILIGRLLCYYRLTNILKWRQNGHLFADNISKAFSSMKMLAFWLTKSFYLVQLVKSLHWLRH